MSNWANTFGGTVDESNVVAGYTWGVGDQTLTGTNEGLADSADAPVAGSFWYGTFGGQQPALSAVAAGVTVPGVGVGVGLPVSNTVECSVQTFELCANNGIEKTHSFMPVDDNGDPINAQGATLVFVVEDAGGNDIETGEAVQIEAGETNEFNISFRGTKAHDKAGKYFWSVREQSNNAPIAHGTLIVNYVPIAGDKKLGRLDSFTTVIREMTPGGDATWNLGLSPLSLTNGLMSATPTVNGTEVTYQRLQSPTIVEGDVTITINGQTANATNLPMVDAQGVVTLELTESEAINGAVVEFDDQDGEWIGVEVLIVDIGKDVEETIEIVLKAVGHKCPDGGDEAGAV